MGECSAKGGLKSWLEKDLFGGLMVFPQRNGDEEALWFASMGVNWFPI